MGLRPLDAGGSGARCQAGSSASLGATCSFPNRLPPGDEREGPHALWPRGGPRWQAMGRGTVELTCTGPRLQCIHSSGSTSSLRRADRKTFTGTNGNIVSGKADRTATRSPTQSKLASTKIAGSSDHLCVKYQMQRACRGALGRACIRKRGRGPAARLSRDAGKSSLLTLPGAAGRAGGGAWGWGWRGLCTPHAWE